MNLKPQTDFEFFFFTNNKLNFQQKTKQKNVQFFFDNYVFIEDSLK